MNAWKIINRIANLIGIVFVVFSVLAAVINYEYLITYYTTVPPAKFIEINILTAILPFLTAAVVSFITAGAIASSMRSDDEQKEEKVETEGTEETQEQAKQKAEFDKMIA
jgi:mannitol-specific phosphotransferase system IIBC component